MQESGLSTWDLRSNVALGLLIWLLLQHSSHLKKCISGPPNFTLCCCCKTPLGQNIGVFFTIWREKKTSLWKCPFISEHTFVLINRQAWDMISIVEIFLCKYLHILIDRNENFTPQQNRIPLKCAPQKMDFWRENKINLSCTKFWFLRSSLQI